jgi:hypothetical protein
VPTTKPTDGLSQEVRLRRSELRYSLREAADASDGRISRGHWGNLESGSVPWSSASYEKIRAVEQVLEWPVNYLWNKIHHSDNTPDIKLEELDYVEVIIMLLSSEGTEMGERTAVVKREFSRGTLYGFENEHNTVHNVSPGQSVIVKAQKLFKVGNMVLVKASNLMLLAYAQDRKAVQVKTIEGITLKTEQVFGRVVARFEDQSAFDQPQGKKRSRQRGE